MFHIRIFGAKGVPVNKSYCAISTFDQLETSTISTSNTPKYDSSHSIRINHSISPIDLIILNEFNKTIGYLRLRLSDLYQHAISPGAVAFPRTWFSIEGGMSILVEFTFIFPETWSDTLRGMSLIHLNQFNPSITAFTSAIRQQDNSILRIARSICYLQTDKLELCTRDCSKAADIDGNNSELYFRTAFAAYLNGQPCSEYLHKTSKLIKSNDYSLGNYTESLSKLSHNQEIQMDIDLFISILKERYFSIEFLYDYVGYSKVSEVSLKESRISNLSKGGLKSVRKRNRRFKRISLKSGEIINNEDEVVDSEEVVNNSEIGTLVNSQNIFEKIEKYNKSIEESKIKELRERIENEELIKKKEFEEKEKEEIKKRKLIIEQQNLKRKLIKEENLKRKNEQELKRKLKEQEIKRKIKFQQELKRKNEQEIKRKIKLQQQFEQEELKRKNELELKRKNELELKRKILEQQEQEELKRKIKAEEEEEEELKRKNESAEVENKVEVETEFEDSQTQEIFRLLELIKLDLN